MTSKAAEKSPEKPSLPKGRGKATEAAGAARRSSPARLLFGTTVGRFLIVAAIGAAVAYWRRDDLIEFFAWSAVPLGLWLASFLYVVLGKWSLIASRWREMLASLAFAFAAAGVMSLMDNPSHPFSPEPMGGMIGSYVTFAPAERPFSLGWADYLTAGVRIAALVLVGIAVAAPRRSARATVVASVWTAIGLGMAWKGLRDAVAKFGAWRADRAETKRPRTEDKNAYEAVLEQEPDVLPPRYAQALERVASDLEPRSFVEPDDSEDPGIPVADVPPWEDHDAQPAAVAAVQPPMYPRPTFNWTLPSAEMLRIAPEGGVTKAEVEATSQLIEESLAQYGIQVTVDQVFTGPTVTMYGLKPGWKGKGDEPIAGGRVRVDAILSREKDLALALASPSLRFEPVVPGESVVGIEVPNSRPTPVTLRSVMDTVEWKEFAKTAALPVPLGLGSGGDPVFADLARMPHTLVAGATGSGKSVCMNTIITGLLMCRSPYQVRMVMVDPKRVELTPYQGIPHLYAPVTVEPDRAVLVLKALVKEMMDRFRTLEQAGVKNIISFNEKSASKMPYLLIMVDELADLMLSASNEVERLLVRLAQLGRATGVHLVIATQRPSVDVVTGLIKANFPSRISFAVMSQVDSRTVLDSVGGEKLLGRGDMLYLPIDLAKPQRVQGAFLSDGEIESVVGYWKKVHGPELPQLEVDFDEEGGAEPYLDDAGDSLFDKAAALAGTQKTLSTSLLQRRLRIGYPRAARLMDELEESGIVGPGEPGKPRRVIGS